MWPRYGRTPSPASRRISPESRPPSRTTSRISRACQEIVKTVFLLDGTTPVAHAEFYCGVFGKNGQTAGSAVFYFDNLPAGKYGVVLLDATSAKGRMMVSVILQQAGTEWKLGGLYMKAAQVGGT